MTTNNGFKTPDYTGNITKYQATTNTYTTVGIVNLYEQHPEKDSKKPDLSGVAYFGTVNKKTREVTDITDRLNIAYWRNKP